jgi:hypothetical protein
VVVNVAMGKGEPKDEPPIITVEAKEVKDDE